MLKRGWNFIKRDKRAIISDYLPWLLIAVAALVIIMIAIVVMSGKGAEAINTIKELFRR